MDLEQDINIAELATLFGVHRHTIEDWVKDGLPAQRTGKAGSAILICLRAAVQWIRERDLRVAKEEADRLREAAIGEETSKGRKLAAEARLKELTVAEREGKMVDVEEVEIVWLQKATTIREAVMMVPGQLVQAGLVEAPSEQKVEAIVRDALIAAVEKLDSIE